jgi:hypothetical protein
MCRDAALKPVRTDASVSPYSLWCSIGDFAAFLPSGVGHLYRSIGQPFHLDEAQTLEGEIQGGGRIVGGIFIPHMSRFTRRLLDDPVGRKEYVVAIKQTLHTSTTAPFMRYRDGWRFLALYIVYDCQYGSLRMRRSII